MLNENATNPKYRVDKFKAASLSGNPLNSPDERYLHIYLPPGYYEDTSLHYPVIYFLHGYGGSDSNIIVVPLAPDAANAEGPYAAEMLKYVDLHRIPSYQMFDEMILSGNLPPFIFVQPDGSLQIPHYQGMKDFLSGMPIIKGSFYINSPGTGNYEDYIIRDVINYTETSYRTLRDKGGRAIAGGSMGGYGTLYLGLRHPDMFASAAALSPGNMTVDMLSWKLRLPMAEMVFGKETSEKIGQSSWDDIYHTLDMVYSPATPLLPTVKRDAGGKLIGYDEKAARNWQHYDLNNLITGYDNPYKDMALMMNCDKEDEFGCAMATEKLHNTLLSRGVKHEYEIYADPMTRLSPHIQGLTYNVIPAIKFCLGHTSQAASI